MNAGFPHPTSCYKTFLVSFTTPAICRLYGCYCSTYRHALASCSTFVSNINRQVAPNVCRVGEHTPAAFIPSLTHLYCSVLASRKTLFGSTYVISPSTLPLSVQSLLRKSLHFLLGNPRDHFPRHFSIPKTLYVSFN